MWSFLIKGSCLDKNAGVNFTEIHFILFISHTYSN